MIAINPCFVKKKKMVTEGLVIPSMLLTAEHLQVVQGTLAFHRT